MSYYANTRKETSSNGLIASSNTDDEIVLVPKTSVIDVVKDFCWTFSPKRGANGITTKVPYVYLKERKQVQNSLAASALYYASSIVNETNAADAIKSINTKLDELTNINIANFLASSNLSPSQSDRALLNDKLKSYTGIYLTEPTGFNYALPYFNNTPLTINNQWQSTSQINTGLGGLVTKGLEIVEEIAYTLNSLQPGTFIEKPKYFNYPEDGNEITVTFPLFNTFRHSQNVLAYKQNYELIWILLYQNKPYRTSFSKISPPKLYTLTVPGQEFFPYCYISNMSIDFQGTRRQLIVDPPFLPTGGPFETSIPEAYVVSITFKNLLINTGNNMVDKHYSSIINARESVSIPTTPPPANPAPVTPTPPIPSNPNGAPPYDIPTGGLFENGTVPDIGQPLPEPPPFT